ncbi:DUF3089 domain-containing protein [Brevundimonas sp. GCM10030266]|uniref:DUF3089 domain-containing protein n=1 Tax=Brevundimonas sp. GCM10030266 TaxID=3273386 RepID=UPI00361E6458
MRLRHVSLVTLIALTLVGTSACAGGPPQSFAQTAPPPAPDYGRPEAWLALPGQDGPQRSVPRGLTPVGEADAPADVFFIHPTTSSASDVWNVPWDAPNTAAPLNPAVQGAQISVFNGCCRLYAPRYRQATLKGLSDDGAVAPAYSDLRAAFRTFVAEHNDGRPFILASHSQGTMHAIRLVQEEVLGTPLQDRLVVAYLIGGYVPADFGDAGLPVCDSARQTGCVVSWNAGKIGNGLSRIVINDKTYWWRGALKRDEQAPALCVNPLSWRAGDAETPEPASANPGSLPFPARPYPETRTVLPPLDQGLTGARCHAGMLEVDLASTAGPTYSDNLTRLAGSYHLQDYGLFYGALWANAVDRVAAWRGAHPSGGQ